MPPDTAMARRIGERAADYIRMLSDENKRLREELAAVVVRPTPEDLDCPGYETWRALMEDARERGEVRLEVREQYIIALDWEPVTTPSISVSRSEPAPNAPSTDELPAGHEG